MTFRKAIFTRPYQVTVNVTWQTPNIVLLQNIKPPIRQKDWPVPQRPVRAMGLYTNINTPRPSQIPNVKPQNRQWNWPVPIRVNYPVGLLTWIESGNVMLPFTAASLPFNQYGWPVPQTPIYPTTKLTWVQSLNPGTVTPDSPSNSIWPTPFIAAEIRQHIPPNIALLNTVPVVSFPFNQYDWPAAKRLPQIQVFYQQNNQGLLATSVTFAPSIVTSFIGPVLPAYPQWQIPNNLVINAIPAGPKPFNQNSWPNPTIAINITSQRTWTASPRVPPVTQPPFNQYDWPLAKLLPYFNYSLFSPLNLSRIVTPDQPSNAVFPLPAAPIVSVQWNAINTLPLLTAPPPVKPPNRQSDWPLPLRPIQLKPDSPINIALTHAGTDTTNIPARIVQTDAPFGLPRIIQFTSANAAIILTPIVNPPIRQHNWPVPSRLPPPLGQFWAQTPGPSRIPNVRPPNRQSYWPLPPRLPPPVGQFWAQSPQTIPPSPVVPSQFDPYVWSEADWRKHQKRLKKRQLELDKEDKQKAKLREQLLRLYRGIDDEQFAQLPSDDILPVRLKAHEDHLDQIALQLAQMQDQLKRHQRELVRRYLADMEAKRDEDEIEMLMSIL